MYNFKLNFVAGRLTGSGNFIVNRKSLDEGDLFNEKIDIKIIRRI